MKLVFGGLEFTTLVGPKSMSKSGSMNFQQVERLTAKPTLQMVGIPLQTIELSVTMFYQFVGDVQTAVSKMWNIMYAGQEHELVDGSGFSYGTFVINKIDETIKKTDGEGRVISCDMDISFLEFAPYNQDVADKLKARKNAFATIEANPLRTTLAPKITAPNQITALNTMQSITVGKAAVSNIRKGGQIQQQATKYIAMAQRQLETARQGLTEARAAAEHLTAAVSNADILKTQLENTLTMNNNVLESLTGASAAELPGIASGTGMVLETQLRALQGHAAKLTNVVATRK